MGGLLLSNSLSKRLQAIAVCSFTCLAPCTKLPDAFVDWREGRLNSSTAEPEADDELALASMDADGLDAAAPYSGTSYEDKDAEIPEVTVAVSDQDPAATLTASDGKRTNSSLDTAQPQLDEHASNSVISQSSMDQAADPQAEAALPAEKPADGSSRLELHHYQEDTQLHHIQILSQLFSLDTARILEK